MGCILSGLQKRVHCDTKYRQGGTRIKTALVRLDTAHALKKWVAK
jgi:hypothetical protein